MLKQGFVLSCTGSLFHACKDSTPNHSCCALSHRRQTPCCLFTLAAERAERRLWLQSCLWILVFISLGTLWGGCLHFVFQHSCKGRLQRLPSPLKCQALMLRKGFGTCGLGMGDGCFVQCLGSWVPWVPGLGYADRGLRS